MPTNTNTVTAAVAALVVAASGLYATNRPVTQMVIEVPEVSHEIRTDAAFPAGLSYWIVDPGQDAGQTRGVESPTGHSVLDRLALTPGVESISPIGDGTYSIGVTNPAVLDGVFVIEADVAFGLTDAYDRYLWGHDNTGSNLAAVTGQAQVSDADADITEAAEGADGAGVVIAVIDSGVDFTHPDLSTASWVNSAEDCGNGIDDDANGYVDDCYGWDFVGNDPTQFNNGASDHGTHVAGVIAAARNRTGMTGVAPRAKIMALNVNRGSYISGGNVAAAIRYAVDNGADIINLSLASAPGAAPTSAITSALAHAKANDVLVVTAAGNHGVDLDTTTVYPASQNFDNMIVVGASTPTDTVAGFSNYGASVVDLFAPGETILSTVPGRNWMFYSGTSQAAPMVSATAALVLQRHPSYGAADIKAEILASVDPVPAMAASGSGGRLNAAAGVGEVDPNGSADTFGVTVSGLDDMTRLNATIDITVPDGHFGTDAYSWDATLVAFDGDNAYAVIDHQIKLGASLNSTDAEGRFALAAGGSASVEVRSQLPDGTYALVLEAVPTDDPTVRLGDSQVIAFAVADATTATTPGTAPVATPSGNDVTSDSTATSGSTGSPDATSNDATTPGAAPADATTPTGPAGTDNTAAGADDTASTGETPTAPAGNGSTSDTSTTVDPSNPATPNSDTSPTDAGTATSDDDTTNPGATDGSTSNPSDTTPTGNDATGTDPAPTEVSYIAPTGPATAADGDWAVTSMSAQTAVAGEPTLVIFQGSFPADVYVWFGDHQGNVVTRSANQLSVFTPNTAPAGVVDISIAQQRVGEVLTLPGGFAFQNPGSPLSGDPSTAPSADAGTDTAPVSGNDQSNETGSTGGPSTSTPSSTGTNPGSTATTQAPSTPTTQAPAPQQSTTTQAPAAPRTPRTPRSSVTGAAVDLGNGLTGSPLSSNPAQGVQVCRSARCEPASR